MVRLAVGFAVAAFLVLALVIMVTAARRRGRERQRWRASVVNRTAFTEVRAELHRPALWGDRVVTHHVIGIVPNSDANWEKRVGEYEHEAHIRAGFLNAQRAT